MIEQRRYSVEEFVTLPNTRDMELVDGLIVEKTKGARAGWIAGNLHTLLGPHVRANRLGHLILSDAGYRLHPDRPRNFRKPDLSFVRRGRLENEIIPDGFISVAPDLAVEVVSPTDLACDVEDKLQEYLDADVGAVWIIYPSTEVVMTFQPDGSTCRLRGNAQLESAELLPGFSCQVAQLFTDEPVAS